MDGMWSYICPDLFAFCEWLFLGEDEPEGLLPEGYIYNHYYDEKEDIDTVCCLRYPHLSDCEHGVRKVLRSEQCKEWFIGEDTIVSCHDLISKVLQADWDGDHICNIHDKAFWKFWIKKLIHFIMKWIKHKQKSLIIQITELSFEELFK